MTTKKETEKHFGKTIEHEIVFWNARNIARRSLTIAELKGGKLK